MFFGNFGILRLTPFNSLTAQLAARGRVITPNFLKIKIDSEGAERGLFNLNKKRDFHTATCGQLGLVEVSRTPFANSQRAYAGDFQE